MVNIKKYVTRRKKLVREYKVLIYERYNINFKIRNIKKEMDKLDMELLGE